MSLKHKFSLVVLASAAACSAPGTGDESITRSEAEDPNAGPVSTAPGGGVGPLDVPSGQGDTSQQVVTPSCTSGCSDFPAEPFYEGAADSSVPTLFGAADNMSAGGCVLEPQLSTDTVPGALIPANWLRPRFRFEIPGDVFEIRISSSVEANDLVAYTTEKIWAIPRDVWATAGQNHAGKTVSVTIRGVTRASGGTPVGVQGDLNIAPVNAGGSMVFWTVRDSNVTPESSKLFGFRVGDEGVVEALKPATVEFSQIIHENGRDLRGEYGGGKPGFNPGDVQCMGCHTSTPDGAAVVFTDDWPWNKAIASIEEGSTGAIPSYLTQAGRALLKMPFIGTQTMSPAYWADNNRVLVTSYSARSAPFPPEGTPSTHSLMWMNLQNSASINDTVPPEDGTRDQVRDARNQAIMAAQNSAWGIITTTGETRNAVTPDWSNSGAKIVYVSTDQAPDGHPDYDATQADLVMVDYNGGAGGVATPIPGASDPGVLEYYPAFSPDDRLIAYTRAPNKGGNSPDGPYYNRYGNIAVIPAEGGEAQRIIANDPISCANDSDPEALLNSWPKWSPHSVSTGGKTYYFLIFSSARIYPGQFNIPRGEYTPATLDTRSSQLYMAAIVMDNATGTIQSYPAVYLWNQNSLTVNGVTTDIQTSNLTPAWDEFLIPIVEEPPA